MDRMDQLLRMTRTAGEEERSLVEDLTEEERAQGGTSQRWAIKDILAHTAVWRQRLAGDLTAIAAGRTPEATGDFDHENSLIFDEHRMKSWDQVLALSQKALKELEEALRVVSDELDTVGLLPWQPERPLWRRVAGTGYLHPMLHLIEYARQRGDAARFRRLSLTMAEQSNALDDAPFWRGIVTYNLACYHALAQETERALELLRSALEWNPDMTEWSRQDPDLEPLRSEPAYERIYAGLDARASADG